MKFLVTGAMGQLAREWVRFLDENGLPYVAFSSGELDITIREYVEKRFAEVSPDVVINCAAYTDVDGAESESKKAFLVNKTGVKNLVEACESAGTKLVHYSTDYVFSGSEDEQVRFPDGYPEDAVTNPLNTYGKSKEAGEKILKQATCDWLLIRVSWLCGRYGSNFVKTMLRLGSEKNELNIIDDQTGSPSLAFDVVEKTCRLLETNKKGIYHIRCRGKISWADFATEIFQQSERKTTVKRISSDEYSFTARRPSFSLLSIKKIEKSGMEILPWKKGISLLLEQVEKGNG